MTPSSHTGCADSRGTRWRACGTMMGALCCILLAFTGGLAHAAPFAKQIEYRQPNGITVGLWGCGDEFQAVFETLDGYTVVFDTATRTYYYAALTADGADLLATGMAAGDGKPQSLGLPKHLRRAAATVKRQAETRIRRWEQGMKSGVRWNTLKARSHAIEQAAVQGKPELSPPASTTTGIKTGLCLLIDFDDDPASIPQATIIDFCNADSFSGYGNNGSVKKYFLDNSNNSLTYTNVVTAYIRIPNSLHPKSYYNDTSLDCGDQANLLIRDAIAILKAMPNYTSQILPTFNTLTVDGGNNVTACNVFYAGGNGNAWSYGLWPHSWSLYNVGSQELSAGGKKVYDYQITNIGDSLEIGTFCHENGHMLCGFPDIYDYDYDSVGGAGSFCLMNSGGYGSNPSQVCAYLKRAAGWATVTDLTSSSSLAASLAATAGAAGFNHFYRYAKPGVSTEYFLIENRQQSGRDAYLPASGIAVWHIDELGNRDNQSLASNTIHANYEVTLVQADNLWHFQSDANSGDARDLYSAGNSAAAYSNTLNDSTSPNAHWWDGGNSGMQLHNFSASGSVMTFMAGNPDANDPTGFTAVVADTTRIDLSWGKNPSNQNVMVAWSASPVFGTPAGSYGVGGTIAGGGTVMYNGSGTGTTHSGLTAGTSYYYKAWSVGSGAGYSTGVIASGNTPTVLAVPFSETFEHGGAIPAGWSQEAVSGGASWTFQAGGYDSHPADAHGGAYNALLYYGAASEHKTKLVTPLIDFGVNTLNAQLSFWYQTQLWSPDQDELRVYYKTSIGGAWSLLASYVSNVSAWTRVALPLPNANRSYFIAFEGNAKYGYGVCIDDVNVANVIPAPEIVVEYPAGSDLTDGVSAIHFNAPSVGGSITRTLTIRNDGLADLTGLAVTRDGTAAGSFTLGALGATTLAAGASTTCNVTFTASVATALTANLHIASNDADENPFDIALSGAVSSTVEFPGSGSIAIPDSGSATPYPSTITVSGIVNPVSAVRVKLNGVSHTYPDDIDIFLVGPDGHVSVILSDAGGSADVVNVNLVCDDAAAAAFPDSSAITSGTYRPANYGSTVESLPPGAIGTIGADLTALAAAGANGEWKLYVSDDSAGDIGTIQSWSLVIETHVPLVAEIAVEEPTGTDLTDGTATTDFGSMALGETSRRTYTIRNPGTANLTGLALAVDGANAADFHLGSLGATSLAPDTSTTFTVTFAPTAAGPRAANLRIASNDSNENPFDIHLMGYAKSDHAELSGLALSAGTLTPAFVSSTTMYDTEVSFPMASITVTPTTADANATVTVNGAAVVSGSASGQIGLIVGSNAISLTVTAEDGKSTRNYGVAVTRKPPNLNIVVSPVTLAVNEGMSNTFTVRLSALTPVDMNVTTTRASGDTDLSVGGGATLVFTATNWNVEQIVTIAAAEDPDAINGQATFEVAAIGMASQTVTATEMDNETAYADWTNRYALTGSDALPGAIPFGDGIANLIKYAFNMDGGGQDARSLLPGTGISGLPVLTRDNSGTLPMIRIEYLRRKKKGMIYLARQSPTLEPASWIPMTGKTTMTDMDAQWWRVVIEQTVDAAAPIRFFSVEVILPGTY